MKSHLSIIGLISWAIRDSIIKYLLCLYLEEFSNNITKDTVFSLIYIFIKNQVTVTVRPCIWFFYFTDLHVCFHYAFLLWLCNIIWNCIVIPPGRGNNSSCSRLLYLVKIFYLPWELYNFFLFLWRKPLEFLSWLHRIYGLLLIG